MGSKVTLSRLVAVVCLSGMLGAAAWAEDVGKRTQPDTPRATSTADPAVDNHARVHEALARPFTDRMTKDEFRETGLHKLSENELAHLNAWLLKVAAIAARERGLRGGGGENWDKTAVVAVVLVKPGIGGFEPVEGNAIGNRWPKQDVTPVALVKPGIGGFEPMNGNAIGNRWMKDDIIELLSIPVDGS